MRGALGEHDEFERHRRQRDQIEPAIGVIGRKQTVEAQHRREQGRHPDNPGANPTEQLGLGPDAERKQQNGQHKEPENQPDIAALPQGEPQLAIKQAEKRRHSQTASAASADAAKSSSAMTAASSSAIV